MKQGRRWSKAKIGAEQEQGSSRVGVFYLFWLISAFRKDFMSRSSNWAGTGAELEQKQGRSWSSAKVKQEQGKTEAGQE